MNLLCSLYKLQNPSLFLEKEGMSTRPQKLTYDFLHCHDTNPIMTADPYIGSSLQDFLEDHRATKGSEISMTGMGAHKGSWMVADSEYEKYLDILGDYLFHKNLRPNNFVEQRKSDGIAPFLVDLDFRYPPEKNLQRTFDESNLHAFTSQIVSVLKETFDLKDRTSLRFFVTLRPQPYQDKKGIKKEIKDGVHIVSPDFTLNSDYAAYIRKKLLEKEAVSKSFEETEYINKDEDVFDETLTKKQGWFFYGESKPDIPPYLLEYVYKYNPKTGKLTTEPVTNYTSLQLLKLLSIRFRLAQPLAVLESKKEELEQAVAKLKNPIVPVSMHVQPKADMSDLLSIILDSLGNVKSSEDQISFARRLVIECLSGDRAESYESWMKVGWCLRNIDPSEEMFEAWMKFSEKSSKAGGNNVEQLRRDWLKGSMRMLNGVPSLRMGSLKMWARDDNPQRYKELMDGDICNYIIKTALAFRGGTHYHTAQMIHKMMPERFKCAVDGRSTEWYEFKDHIWGHMPNGIIVKSQITDQLTFKVDVARQSLPMPKVDDPEYKEKLEKYQENMTKILKLQENLFNANFKDSVMKEAIQLYYDQDFSKLLNTNPYLLGCANGILNLREPVFNDQGIPVAYKPTLRPGTIEDNISYAVGITPKTKYAIEYKPYDPMNPIYIEIMDFFNKLFPQEDLREYVLTLAAGCLEGANKEQCFYIMTGCGGNGKSKFTALMNGVMGQYAGSLATTALTRKRPDSGAANPDIIGIKGKRFIEMKEPDDGESLNTARMKQFSGEDLVEARGLFKDQEYFEIMGKIFLSSNRLPPIHSMDGGTWRRLRVIPFNSRFVAKGDPLDPENHVYPRDPMMDEKIKRWIEPFFSLLVHYYETRYCPDGITHVPRIVMEACDEYKSSHDAFGKFIKTRVRTVPGYDDPPTFDRFWKAYRNWHMQENPSGKRLSQNELKIRLNEMFKAPADGKTYKHKRLFDNDEEIEEFDNEKKEAQETA